MRIFMSKFNKYLETMKTKFANLWFKEIETHGKPRFFNDESLKVEHALTKPELKTM